MSWSSPVRVLGVCGVWLAIQTGCGGVPDVAHNDTVTNGGTSTGGAASVGGSSSTGGLNINHSGGQNENEGGGNDGPTTYVCGNGELEPGEFCEDGNTVDGDGCSADCSVLDPKYDCSAVGEECVQVVVCGNGVLEGDEVCDDLNTDGSDGCAADCSAVESGWACARPGKPCFELPVCGNGEREIGEQCDDHNAASDDGCSASCQLEPGYLCPPGVACKPLVCGDGERTPGEQCDDGQMPPTAGDGCSATCQVEPGFHCSAAGCAPLCGDGLLRGDEECDDTNRLSGDGCSAACFIEPFFACAGEPSTCSSTIMCNNGILEPGEKCDPVGTDGCLPGCISFSPGPGATCGNGIIEAPEECDKPGTGCSTGCTVLDGYTCPRPNTCFALPRCGDGVLNKSIGEECDDGNSVTTDGCADCDVVPPYTCYGLQPSVCIKEVCGDGIRTPSEACDDGSFGTGCTGCVLDTGWICPTEGKKCVERCGDGIKVGTEECDDKNLVNKDGCNAGCRIEPDFTCPTVGAACVPAVCGNNVVESGEGCDDGGKCVGGTNAGNACTKDSQCPGAGAVCGSIGGDKCGPTCQKEPTVTVGPNPTVNLEGCGDGLITAGEKCDDGNKVGGDGCSADCKTVEPEFNCSDSVKLPESVNLQVTYRDFKKATSSGGHPDFEHNPYGATPGVPGPVCTRATTECTAAAGVACTGGTCGHLDSEGKPAFHLVNTTPPASPPLGTVTSSDLFGLWYRDSNTTVLGGGGVAVDISPVVSFLTLDQQGGALSDVYQFTDNSFYPLTGKAFGNNGNAQNYHFTTELRYFFQYKGGETLTFTGDDDVWVFVNGRHAVDIGGVHGARNGRVILGDDGGTGATDSNCSVHGAALTACTLEANEISSNDDVRFGLTKGQVYEIVLFQAERHTSESNFQLTLAGFLAPRTYCTAKCGDGKVVAGEVCDDGAANADGVSGKCNTTCTMRAVCGDNVVQTGEVCDNGTNLDLYWDGTATGKCAPGCKTPSKCGDGKVETDFEECDNGASNNDASYGPGSCTKACKLGAYCGDGKKNGTEACDLGAANGGYGPTSCGYDCKAGPKCGDNIRNGAEECDGTANCNATCKLDPYCGDGVTSSGEECDNGKFSSTDYGGCTNMCKLDPYCGDGTKNGPEECDLGDLNSTSYDGCTTACTAGPHCGDAEVQADHSEICDNGFNEDDYAYTPDACGPGCLPVPYCGDNKIEPGVELCDDGTATNNKNLYDGCNSKCDYGPYCGDGEPNGPELCDEGADNVSYSPEQGGCGYDCSFAPYCGDGERNGPEQCDLGEDNTGDYGTCNPDCTFAPRCGDKVKQTGEQCDDGPSGSLNCSPTCKKRTIVQ